MPLAPLHQPHNLAPIRILRERFPDLPQIACFDTGFHRDQPEIAQLFALPRAMTESGVRRYGFHGLSYAYIASVLPHYDPALASGRVVVAHLGNGASLCALDRGASIATTMGISALDGLPMGTRCGALYPGVVFHMLRDMGEAGRRALDELHAVAARMMDGVADGAYARTAESFVDYWSGTGAWATLRPSARALSHRSPCPESWR